MIRWSLAVTFALLINLLLFLAMGAMVRHSQLRLDPAQVVSVVDFVRPSEPQPPPPAHRSPSPEPPRPRALVPLPRVQAAALPRPDRPRIPAPKVELDLGLPPIGTPYLGEMAAPTAPEVISARELMATLTLPPRYPPAARAGGTEGFVEVEFTVTAEGATEDIHVIAAHPPGVFDEATERAIRGWRFQPHRSNGRPVEARVRQRVDFRLDQR
jgi:protein TonB